MDTRIQNEQGTWGFHECAKWFLEGYLFVLVKGPGNLHYNPSLSNIQHDGLNELISPIFLSLSITISLYFL